MRRWLRRNAIAGCHASAAAECSGWRPKGRYPRKPHRDSPPAKAGGGVGKLRRTIPPRPAKRVAEQTGLNIGEVERTVVMSVIAVRETLRGRNGVRSDIQESQDSEYEMLWHMTLDVHHDTPLATGRGARYPITSIKAD